jgi:hypothetical protein
MYLSVQLFFLLKEFSSRNVLQCNFIGSKAITLEILNIFRHPNGKETAELLVIFCPSKNIFAELFIKVFVGYSIEYFHFLTKNKSYS